MTNNIALLDVDNSVASLIDQKEFHIDKGNSNEDAVDTIVKNADIVIVDLEQKNNFKQLLQQINHINSNALILGLIDCNRIRIATKLLKENLADYIVKEDDQLKSINMKLEQLLHIDHNATQETNLTKISLLEFINSNGEMKKTINNIINIANANMPIIIQGESGCKHELYAETIHNMSDRKDNMFLNIFCPSINREDLEKILNHDKSINERLQQLNNGTLFLENIDLMNTATQNLMVRILKKNNSKKSNINIRVIASTNKDLMDEVKLNHFNKELYYLIDGYTLHIPPLRKMRHIIPLLVKNLYKQYSIEQNKTIHGITNRALTILEAYPWRGNIDEIKNVIHRAVILCKHDILDEDDFKELKNEKNEKNDLSLNTINIFDENGNLKDMKTMEREIIDKYMTLNGGNVSKVAKCLNLGRATLYRKMEEDNK